MKKLILILAFLFVFMFSGVAVASVNLDAGNFTAAYTEPIINEDGTPLGDLDHTTIYYSLDGAPKVKVTDIPATSLNGGGIINNVFTINGLGNQVNVAIIYTATDLVGNESGEFIEPIIRIDQVAPSAPTG